MRGSHALRRAFQRILQACPYLIHVCSLAATLRSHADRSVRRSRTAAGFLYSLGKRLRTGSARTGSDPPFRTNRDARGRSPVGRRGPDGGGGPADREPRNRSPPPPRGGGVIRGSVMRPAPAPRLHPDAERLLDTLTRDGRVRPGDVNERCIAALSDKPPAVQVWPHVALAAAPRPRRRNNRRGPLFPRYHLIHLTVLHVDGSLRTPARRFWLCAWAAWTVRCRRSPSLSISICRPRTVAAAETTGDVGRRLTAHFS